MKMRISVLMASAVLVLFLVNLIGCANAPVGKKTSGTQKPKTQKIQPAKTKTTSRTATNPKAASDQEAQQLLQRGIGSRQSGDMNAAIAAFEKALKRDPDNAEIAKHLRDARDERQRLIDKHLNAGVKFFNQDLLTEAIQEWDAVLALDPSNQEASNYKKQAQQRLDALSGKK